MNSQQCVQQPNSVTSSVTNSVTNSVTLPNTESSAPANTCADNMLSSKRKAKNTLPAVRFFTNEFVPGEALFNLLKVLPLTGLWTSHYNPRVNRIQHAYYSENSNHFSTETVEYLSAQRWLTGELAERLIDQKNIALELEIPDKALSQPYLFTYGPDETALDETALDETAPLALDETAPKVVLDVNTVSGYWLVWAHEPLTQIHKYCIEQQMHYLNMSQNSQQATVRLRQQVRSLQKNLSRAEHQLRTPLSLVELCADLLQKNISTQSLKDQAQFICKTVDDINLSLQRLTRWDDAVESDRVLCDLKQVVLETIDSLKVPLEQNQITITSEMPSLMLTLDVWKIKQVFSNLFSNAIAFSPSGSTISCHWHVFQSEVLIEICDQGPGFSAEDLAKLFTPFYSRRHNGTGLGMIIAKDIISAHQGRLWVANQPAGGAVISIALPRL